MTTKVIRENFHTVTPYLIVTDADPLVVFVTIAFGAKETYRAIGADGGTHVEVQIGDSIVMIGGSGGAPLPTTLFLYVDDVDGTYNRALAAGANSVEELNNTNTNERREAVQDLYGSCWYIAKPIEA